MTGARTGTLAALGRAARVLTRCRRRRLERRAGRRPATFRVLLYVLRRILLMVPTLVGVLLINFVIIQAAPGGPVDQAIARLQGTGLDAGVGLLGGGAADATFEAELSATGGIDPALIEELERQFGFDKPAHVRFGLMLRDYLRFDLGESFYQDVPVIDLVLDRLPVSMSLGLWTLLIVYSVSIPLGIRKATADGSPFDVWTSVVILVGYAIPGFILAVLLIVLFARGGMIEYFPLRGLVSDDFADLGTWAQVKDYFWHLVLPITALVAGSFATLTTLTKNSFLDEINKQYVLTAKAKGLKTRRVLYGHVFRNAMLIVIAGFPRALVGALFTGVLLAEIIFSLDGLGLLGFEAIVTRDYPIIFGTLYISTLLALVLQLLTDITYTLTDPRIDFETRDV